MKIGPLIFVSEDYLGITHKSQWPYLHSLTSLNMSDISLQSSHFTYVFQEGVSDDHRSETSE